MARASRWLSLFREFVKDIRIVSKEVVSEDERGSPLVLWESQKRFLDEVGQGLDDGIRRFNCLKSRQLGCTTISLAIDLFWLALHPNLTMALVSDTEENRDSNRMILRGYVGSFPDGYFGDTFRIVKGGDNRKFMKFSNGSRIDFLVAGTKRKSVAWAEGRGYAACHATEIAKYGDAKGLTSFLESLAQTNPARLFIFESTANGYNHWHSIWTDGQKKETERSFFIGWWASDVNKIWRTDSRWDRHGGYQASGEERDLVRLVARQYEHVITPEQLCWIRWKEEDAGAEADMLRQNQPWTAEQAFVLSGYSFFQTRQISKDLQAIYNNPDDYGFTGYYYRYGHDFWSMELAQISSPDEHHLLELKVWDEPADGGRYVIGCDPAWGRNEHKDRHAISVWRCFADQMVQVAEYATANVDPKHCAWVLAHLAGAYENCMVNIEIQGPGRLMMQEWDHLRGMLAAEMYAEKTKSKNWENALHQARWYLYSRPDSPGKGYAYNFQTNINTLEPLMMGYRSSYITNELVIRSKRLLEEMVLVVVDGAHIGAPESSAADTKDDRVFAAAFAGETWRRWIRPEMIAQGLTYDVVMSHERGEMKPIVVGLNSIVARFFKSIAQLEAERENPPPPPRWMTDRGLA